MILFVSLFICFGIGLRLIVLTSFLALPLEDFLGLTLVVATPLLLPLPGSVTSVLLLYVCPLIMSMRFPNSVPILLKLDVSRTASYEITLVRVSIRPSVRPSLTFLKTGSLVFSDIVHDGS